MWAYEKVLMSDKLYRLSYLSTIERCMVRCEGVGYLTEHPQSSQLHCVLPSSIDRSRNL